MYAADTNVVVRVLVGDDKPQQKAALTRLKSIRSKGGSVLVGVVVLAEVAWVLAAAYEYDREQIVEAIRGLIWTPPFVVSHRAEVLSALDMYEKGSADFADYLILALARSAGCPTLLTFDRNLVKSSGVQRP